jgi:hypothetical protein
VLKRFDAQKICLLDSTRVLFHRFDSREKTGKRKKEQEKVLTRFENIHIPILQV